MAFWINLIILIAPLGLIVVGALSFEKSGLRPRRLLGAARAAAVATFLLALLGVIAVAIAGPLTGPLLGREGIGLSVRLDAFSAVMFLLVSFVGLIVVRFGCNYLDGDARQGMFVGGICLTLAAVSLLVLSGNLFQLVAAWIATSLALHRLLVFYAERPAAVLAARKKFVTARIGDLCLIAAALLLASAFGTDDIASILNQASAMDPAAAPGAVLPATLLIVGAALLKSAQFPAHGWLPEVMETPTPVSALLHAGIINAGGFLVIRFADVMLLSAPSLYLLAIVGGFTALFGGVVMLTQPSVKVSLAWSTVAQMGFMLLQCGLGAFSIAVLHILAHSLYKAHAFLASGSVVDIARSEWVPDLAIRPRPGQLLASLALSLCLYAGIGWLFDVTERDSAALLAFGAIVVMGLTLLLAQALQGGSSAGVLGRSVIAAACVAVAYFTVQWAGAWLLSPALPPIPEPGAAGLAIMALAVLSFAAVTVLQILAPLFSGSPGWRAARVHIANGLYVNAVFNRLVGALRLPQPTGGLS